MSTIIVILPEKTRVQAGGYPGVACVELTKAAAAQVSSTYVYDTIFRVSSMADEEETPILTGLPLDFVEGKPEDFASGATTEEAWANYHARKE